jgi:hypothetical protein
VNDGVLNAIRSGVAGPDEYRVLNMPRCRVYNTPGEAGHGPGTATIGWSANLYDTDNMTFQPGSTANSILIRTPGLYICSANLETTGGSGVSGIWVRIQINSNFNVFVAEWTEYRDPALFGAHMTISGPRQFNAGDQIQLAVNTTAAMNITGGSEALWLAASMISTL